MADVEPHTRTCGFCGEQVQIRYSVITGLGMRAFYCLDCVCEVDAFPDYVIYELAFLEGRLDILENFHNNGYTREDCAREKAEAEKRLEMGDDFEF